MSAPAIPRVLSIAGSDSGGGAGIQADLKAFAACGVHGMTALTAITAQNTLEVRAVQAVPPQMIIAQVQAVIDDIGVDAVKIGMLGTEATIAAVLEALSLLPPQVPVVLDPVMVAESGSVLLEAGARRSLIAELLPRMAVVTPNLAEARVIAAMAGPDRADPPDRAGPADPHALARAVHALGVGAVIVTGGHREVASDVLFDGEEMVELEGVRYDGGAAHGSGCTHSSALAARLAHGDSLLEAARLARFIAGQAVRHGLTEIGAGAGPVDVIGIRSPRFSA